VQLRLTTILFVVKIWTLAHLQVSVPTSVDLNLTK